MHFTRNPLEGVNSATNCMFMSCSLKGILWRQDVKRFFVLPQTAPSGIHFKHLKTRSPFHTDTHTHVCVCVHNMGDDEGVINGLCVFLVLQGIFPPKWLWLLWVLRNQVLLFLVLSSSLLIVCTCVCLRVRGRTCVWQHTGRLSSDTFSPCCPDILFLPPRRSAALLQSHRGIRR